LLTYSTDVYTACLCTHTHDISSVLCGVFSQVPVPAAPNLASAAHPSTLSFDYEHRILKELEQPQTSGRPAAVMGATTQDPYEFALKQFVSRSISREDAAVGLALVGGGAAANQDAVKRAAHDYKALKDMGFPATVAAGALVTSKGNMEEAANAAANACP
jgi:hypothetical protein